MVVIQPLRDLDEHLLKRLIVGYTTFAIYQVSKTETSEHTSFELRLTPLEQPLIKRYQHLDAETVRRYAAMARQGHSFGAYIGEECVGIALTELHTWNASLWVQEFHVAPEYRGRGVGRRLMDTLTAHARTCAVRCIVCETQTSDVPAIQFYRAMGFFMDGIDLSYYSNRDQERGEVAVFMKTRISDESTDHGSISGA
jgi:ribosomal protein S18 acetylase RimI-like enzyme